MKRSVLLVTILILGISVPAFSIRIGMGDFYVNVGDYDYLPYNLVSSPQSVPQSINFSDVMGQYGNWSNDQQFGRVWQPYSADGWRPYMHGRWMNTQYGPTWEGYEPWAWAAYHYGDWIHTQNSGWAWTPGDEWHPGRVAWAQGNGSVGWMPLPPQGYDYSRGYLAPSGTTNQFDYYDPDFGSAFSGNNYNDGGPYYNPQFREAYYNPSYLNNVGNFWTFIDSNGFTADDYADYYLGADYARMAFDQRAVRVSGRPINTATLQQIVRQQIPVTPVETREIQTAKRPLRIVVPVSADAVERVRKNSNRVVREVVAPAFAEKQKEFKGQNSKQATAINKMFKQENVQPQVQDVDNQQVVKQAQEERQRRETQRKPRAEQAKQKLAAVKSQSREPSAGEPQRRPQQQQPAPPPEQRKPEAQPMTEEQMRERTPQQQPRQPDQQPVQPRETQPENKQMPSMNDDARITRQIQEKISNLSTLSDDNINVQVRNGEVVLHGSVNNPQNENKAIQIAQSVPGVKAVRSQIQVKRKEINKD